MRAITICQPYAELIAAGIKRVENRRWFTSWHGVIAIHAGKSKSWLDSYDPLPARMDFGAVIAIGRLITCLHVDKIKSGEPLPAGLEWLRTHEHVEGPWCFVLADVERIVRPIAISGKQGWWDFDARLLPEEVQARWKLHGGTSNAK